MLNVADDMNAVCDRGYMIVAYHKYKIHFAATNKMQKQGIFYTTLFTLALKMHFGIPWWLIRQVRVPYRAESLPATA